MRYLVNRLLKCCFEKNALFWKHLLNIFSQLSQCKIPGRYRRSLTPAAAIKMPICSCLRLIVASRALCCAFFSAKDTRVASPPCAYWWAFQPTLSPISFIINSNACAPSFKSQAAICAVNSTTIALLRIILRLIFQMS